MSLLRRRAMMQAGSKEDAKYPFASGRHDFSDGSYVISTNGNHVYVHCAQSNRNYINVSNVDENSNDVNDLKNIDFHPEWLSLKKGDICELQIKNITFVSKGIFASNFRKANSDVSSTFGYGDINSTNDLKVQRIVSNDESLSCYFFYFTNIADFECDVEFFVNGERWI